MNNHRQEDESIEVREPVAHPHYPRRPAGAAHHTLRMVVAEAEERDPATDNDLPPE